MLNGRIYRAASMPLLAAIVVVALSLGNQAPGLSATAPAEGFDGQWTARQLERFAQEFPRRPPGSAADDRFAQLIADELAAITTQGPAGPSAARPAFKIRVRGAHGATVVGGRKLLTVIAERAGSSGLSPIVIVSHRDAMGRGAKASLSGSAALLELARVLANRQSTRTIVLVSTSGGSGGDAGAKQLASEAADSSRLPWNRPAGTGAPTAAGGAEGETGAAEASPQRAAAPEAPGDGGSADAVLLLGDLASSAIRQPTLGGAFGQSADAPEALVRTLASSLRQSAGVAFAPPSFAAQVAGAALPLSSSEATPFNAAGLPAIQLQFSGDYGPQPAAAISDAHLEAAGTAILNAIGALDGGASIAASDPAPLRLGSKTIPGWAIALLVAALLLPAAAATVDGLARIRRRRERPARAVLATALWSLPFLLPALALPLVGWMGLAGALAVLPAAPGAAFPLAAGSTLLAIAALLCAAGWRLRTRLLRALALPATDAGAAGGMALLLVTLGTAGLLWLVNPIQALLLVPAAHLWLAVADPKWRSTRRSLRIAVVVLGSCGLIFLASFAFSHYSAQVGGWIWLPLRLLTAGQLDLATILLGSLALGCLLAALRLAWHAPPSAATPPGRSAAIAGSAAERRRSGATRVRPERPALRH